MVAPRETVKIHFAERLNQALDAVTACPPLSGRGRVAWLARGLKVSDEAAKKWVRGIVLPDQTNMARLAQLCNVTPQWLHAGQAPMRPKAQDQLSTRLEAAWEGLSAEGRLEAVKLIEMAVAKYPKDPPGISPTHATERQVI